MSTSQAPPPPLSPLTPLDESWSRGLAVVAHPDDLEFGAAAAIARWTGQGKHIVYVMVTSGEAGIDALRPEECKVVREAEEVESARIVGVDTVEFLGFAHAPALVRVELVDPRLSARHHDVHELLALRSPSGDRCGRAELEIVGVGHHTQSAAPRLVDRFKISHGHSVRAAPRPAEGSPTACAVAPRDDPDMPPS